MLIIGGESSSVMELTNSVFQGTMLSFSLWNMFYADGALATQLLRVVEVVFADDYNCWKPFPNRIDRTEILRQCGAC